MQKLNISFVDPLGLEYNGHTLKERGLGGSEASVVYMARELAKLNFSVTVYNNCDAPGKYDGVYYENVKEGPKTKTPQDVVVSVRSPTIFYPQSTDKVQNAFSGDFVKKAKLRVMWMHDTFSQDDNSIEPLLNEGLLDEVWTLSDFHTNYITNCFHNNSRRNYEVLKNKIWQTRNGVNVFPTTDIKREHDHFVFNSAYSKGMRVLLEKVWPKLKQKIPNAKLTIVGGYYLFPGALPDKQGQDVIQWQTKLKNDKSVTFTGIITPQKISEVLQSAGFLLYPTEYPETFGISTLESIVYRTPVITSVFGALEETAIDLASYKLPYSTAPNNLFPNINENVQVERFVELAYNAWNNRYLYMQKQNYCDNVKDVVGWDKVALQWKQHIYSKTDNYLPVDELKMVRYITNKVNRLFKRRFQNPEDLIEQSIATERRINVVITVRNSEKYIRKCLESVLAQDYQNCRIYITDDSSTDSTVKEITECSRDFKHNKDIKIQLNTERKGAVWNQLSSFDVINNHNDPDYCDMVIILDGDDKLRNDPNIFKRLNNLYWESDIRFTYGSCWSMVDNIPLIAQDYPENIVNKREYRKHLFPWNVPYTHLRTFRADMISGIRLNELKDETGNYMKAGGDTAMFYEMIERCQPNQIRAIKDILVDYNDINPLNDYKINSEEQTRNAKLAISRETKPEPKNDEENKMKSILVAIPTAKYIEPETFKAIYDLIKPNNTQVEFQYFYGYNIDQVRNLIADYSINNRFDWVFWVDSDISFARDTLVKLLSRNKEIIGGVYRQRKPDQILEVFDKSYRSYTDTKTFTTNPFEVGAVGFGCVLTKTSVLQSVGYPQFDYHRAISIENTLSEDVDFCKKAKAVGISTWVDPSIICEHHGKTSYMVI